MKSSQSFSEVGRESLEFRGEGLFRLIHVGVQGHEVVRCSGAKVLRTPSHVKASLTGTKVVRSLWAALGVVWVTGVLVGLQSGKNWPGRC
jgi:hypothetical protein